MLCMLYINRRVNCVFYSINHKISTDSQPYPRLLLARFHNVVALFDQEVIVHFYPFYIMKKNHSSSVILRKVIINDYLGPKTFLWTANFPKLRARLAHYQSHRLLTYHSIYVPAPRVFQCCVLPACIGQP